MAIYLTIMCTVSALLLSTSASTATEIPDNAVLRGASLHDAAGASSLQDASDASQNRRNSGSATPALDAVRNSSSIPNGTAEPLAVYNERRPWIEQISKYPRAYLYHNFLSHDEADHLIQLASPNLAKSKVIVAESGMVADSLVRTSSGAWIQRGQDAVVSRIEQRIANWTSLPVENGEAMHVLHYAQHEEYQPHYDCYFDDNNIKNGGQRVATVIMYLSTVGKGGETVFPWSPETPSAQDSQLLSVCAQQGVAARAVKGDALLFYSVLPDGETLDQLSVHASCPVVQGEKWAATKWLRADEWINAPLSQVEAIKRERELLKQRELHHQAGAAVDKLTEL